MQHYALREASSVETSLLRYKQMHRDEGVKEGAGLGAAVAAGGSSQALDRELAKMSPEHVNLPLSSAEGQAAEDAEGRVEREMQLEMYGSRAMKMMEKMGYSHGSGLGREGQGRTKLLGPALALEAASQNLGQGSLTMRSKVSERAARLADARAKKHRRVDESAFVQHNLLSSDESSEGEEEHRKVRDSDLT